MLLSMESFALIPVILTYSSVFASSFADEAIDVTSLSVALIYPNKAGAHDIKILDETTCDAHFDIVQSSKVCTDVFTEVPIDTCNNGVYLFKEWTSSTGLLFTVLLLYIGLATITNIIVVYKFIATWNQITLSLREQNRVCAKYANVPSSRRQTCQEALKPSRYKSEERCTSVSCPICLVDIRNQDLVVTCDNGCETKFHKDCLYDWLECKGSNDNVLNQNHTSCPCCRKELIGIISTDPKPSTLANGFISDLSTLVGFYPC